MSILVRNVIKQRSDWASRHHVRSVQFHHIKTLVECVLLTALAVVLVTQFNTILGVMKLVFGH